MSVSNPQSQCTIAEWQCIPYSTRPLGSAIFTVANDEVLFDTL